MNGEERGIKVVTILGTARPGNYTGKALRIVNQELGQSGVDVDFVDSADLALSFPGQNGSPDAAELRARVKQATALILATPEYHGSFSSMLKLVIENLGFPSVLSGKPVALLGVAAGRIGAIKSLEHLRGVCSHIGAIVLPAPLSVANVQQVFDEEGKCLDEKVEKMLRSLARNLLDYVHKHVCPRLTLEAIARGDFSVDELGDEGLKTPTQGS